MYMITVRSVPYQPEFLLTLKLKRLNQMQLG